MLENDKKIELSKYNKLGELMTFYESDGFLDEFIDFVGFYGKRKRERILHLLKSDNGGSIYLSKRLVLNSLNGFSNFRAMVSVSVYGSPINVVQLREIKLGGKNVLDVDLYGKGCKLIREEGLRDELFLLFNYYLGMEDIVLTRADYTVDCQKMNFRKANGLKCKISGLIRENGQVAYMTFGKKSHDSAKFLRYYDKKQEIMDRGTSHLYPEYSLLKSVMRYELQVNSKGFDSLEKEISIHDLYNFIMLNKEVSSSRGRHNPKDKDWTCEELAKKCIRKLQKDKDFDGLDRLKLLLCGVDYFKYKNSECYID